MMHDIHFKILSESYDVANPTQLAAEGSDGLGPFTLEGTLSRIDGRLSLTKHYIGTNTRWCWSAVLAPFGLLGTWGKFFRL